MSGNDLDVCETCAPSRLSEFVPVAFAKDPAHAEAFRCALEDRGIPSLIEAEPAAIGQPPPRWAAVPVLVPDHWLDEASGIIAEYEEADDFDVDLAPDEGVDEDLDDLDEDEDDDLDDFDDDFDDDNDEDYSFDDLDDEEDGF